MRYATFVTILLVPIGIGLTACGSSDDEYTDSTDDAAEQDLAPEEQAALMRQAARTKERRPDGDENGESR